MLKRIKTNIIVANIIGFLGAAPGAVKQYLNVNELVRIVVAVIVSGGTAYQAVAALASNVPDWVAPEWTGVATAVFVLVLEAWRRLGQGKTTLQLPPAPNGFKRAA
jgi:hypothetical protein